MKIVIRYFFRGLRIILGPFVLLWELLTKPKGINREENAQKKVDQQTKELILYQYKTCPFCIKVRQEMRRLSINIEKLDAQKNEVNKATLLEKGGKVQVPCLRIQGKDEKVTWLYDSDEIIKYLRERFS